MPETVVLRERYYPIDSLPELSGENVYFFEEDKEYLYMRLEDVVRLLKRREAAASDQ